MFHHSPIGAASTSGTYRFFFFDSWPGYEAAFAIDGNRGHEEFDHAAHPEKGAHIASFFVQSTNESVVYYVEV